jgi:hypothetical protein
MKTMMAYLILVFYGILAIITAAIGNYIKPVGGFSMGYVFGAILSIVLWYSVGRNMVNA